MIRASSASERFLVGLAAYLSVRNDTNGSLEAWLEEAKELVIDCGNCAPSLIEVRGALDRLANAERGKPRENALFQLRLTMAGYLERVAANRFAVWKESKGEASDASS